MPSRGGSDKLRRRTRWHFLHPIPIRYRTARRDRSDRCHNLVEVAEKEVAEGSAAVGWAAEGLAEVDWVAEAD